MAASGAGRVALSTLPVGALLDVEVAPEWQSRFGAVITWRVADQGHEGYPAGCTTLISDRIIQIMCADAAEPENENSNRVTWGNNRYIHSNLHQWLNSDAPAGQWYSPQHQYDAPPTSEHTLNGRNPYDQWAGFLAMLPRSFAEALLDTPIRVQPTDYDTPGGFEVVAAKVYLPGTTEVGGDPDSILGIEGPKLALFGDDQSRLAYPTEAAVKSSNYTNNDLIAGNAWNWWMRTPMHESSYWYRIVQATGKVGTTQYAYHGGVGIRPLCNLPGDTEVEPSVTGNYVVAGLTRSGKGRFGAALGGVRRPTSVPMPVLGGVRRMPSGLYAAQGGVEREVWPGGVALSDLPLGALIDVAVRPAWQSRFGEHITWRVADQGHAGYPEGCTTLITDKIIQLMCVDAKEPGNPDNNRGAYGNNRYILSNIHQWLNSDAAAGQWYSAKHPYDTPPANDYVSDGYNEYDQWDGFLAMLDGAFAAALLKTTLTTTRHVDDGGSIDTFSALMFLPSAAEVNTPDGTIVAQGTKLAIFDDNASRFAYPSAQAVGNSEYASSSIDVAKAGGWWLRVPNTTRVGGFYMHYIDSRGVISNMSAYNGLTGIRPLCNLPGDARVHERAGGGYRFG